MSQFSDPNFKIKLEKKFNEVIQRLRDHSQFLKMIEDDMKTVFLDGIKFGIDSTKEVYSDE